MVSTNMRQTARGGNGIPDLDTLNDTQKLQLAERANEIYRRQIKFMKQHLASLRSLIQDKDNIIENITMRYDCGILKHTAILSDGDGQNDECRRGKVLAQCSILENVEMKSMLKQLGDKETSEIRASEQSSGLRKESDGMDQIDAETTMTDSYGCSQTEKLQLAERANDIYRQQLKCMQDYLPALRSKIQDKENVISSLVLRCDLGCTQSPSDSGTAVDDDKEDHELRQAQTLVQRVSLVNHELRIAVCANTALSTWFLAGYIRWILEPGRYIPDSILRLIMQYNEGTMWMGKCIQRRKTLPFIF